MEKKKLVVIYLTTLMAVLGVASIIPAFPSIVQHFNISPTQVTLLITVFTLPGIFLSPVVGILADRFGRKVILTPSLFLFGIAGFACILTNSWQELLVLRFFQGVGAASLGTLNITLIGDLFKGEKRGTIMGYNAAVLSTGTALYPAIGGSLAMLGWRIPFILPLIAIPAGILVILWLDNTKLNDQPKIKEYLKNTWIIINRKHIWGLFIITVLLFTVLYGALLSYFPQLMVERFQATPGSIGLLISLSSIATALSAAQKKRTDKMLSLKYQLNLGAILFFFSMLLFSVADNYFVLIIALFAFGVGNGILLPGIQTFLVGSAPLSQRAGFMSINSMILRIGQTSGPLLIGLFYLFGGLKITFIGAAFVALSMLAISVLMLKQEKLGSRF